MNRQYPREVLADPISVRIPDAVRLTGLSRSRIYELMRTRELEFVKVGGCTLILFDSLRALIGSKRASEGKLDRV